MRSGEGEGGCVEMTTPGVQGRPNGGNNRNNARECIICSSRGKMQPIANNWFVLCPACNARVESDQTELKTILTNSIKVATDINRRSLLFAMLESIESI